MLGIGWSEMILIAGIALVVIGPEKFPEFAKVALRAYRDFKGYMDDAKREIAKELQPMKDEVKTLSRYRTEDYLDLNAPAKPATPKPAVNIEDQKIIDAGTKPYGTGADDDFSYNPEPDESSFKTAGQDEVALPAPPAEEPPSREEPVPYAAQPYEMDRPEKQEVTHANIPELFDEDGEKDPS
ncbi:MAG: twin-arginine translocase TatA/TatE family subunit [Candidatus Hydrogenedentes bacterium]|nr:twin-arginine translocase TatA/TatE family subunit [Candidatus Hydrogenedentota bacterium]